MLGWRIRLRGDGKQVNRDALGAKVTVEVAGQKVVRELKSSRGTYNSADGRALLFGLADATCPATVTVRWPTRQDGLPSERSPSAATSQHRLWPPDSQLRIVHPSCAAFRI
jgi:hypothetical protein